LNHDDLSLEGHHFSVDEKADLKLTIDQNRGFMPFGAPPTLLGAINVVRAIAQGKRDVLATGLLRKLPVFDRYTGEAPTSRQ
jgi:hypothetical protein